MITFPTSYQCIYVSEYAYRESSIYDAPDITVSVLLNWVYWGNFQWAYDSMATSYNGNTIMSTFY